MKKKYCFSYQKSYGEEIFFFEDEQENAVVIEANSPKEAEDLLIGMINNEYEDDAKIGRASCRERVLRLV